MQSDRRSWYGYSRLQLVALLFCAFLLYPFIAFQFQKREWRALVQAGGGEMRYVAADTICRRQPHTRYQGKGRFPDVTWGAQAGVFARENGWSLIGAAGEPCWMPDWALSEARPVAEVRSCGIDCHPMAPPGWFEAQAEAACRYDMHQRFMCFLERVLP